MQFITNEFTEVELSDAEIGSALNAAKSGFFFLIQNERAQVARNLIGLKLDPNNVAVYQQDQAFMQGQLEAYNLLIDLINSNEDVV